MSDRKSNRINFFVSLSMPITALLLELGKGADLIIMAIGLGLLFGATLAALWLW
jgi:hypothetical protein